jgi:hypothetical protein
VTEMAKTNKGAVATRRPLKQEDTMGKLLAELVSSRAKKGDAASSGRTRRPRRPRPTQPTCRSRRSTRPSDFRRIPGSRR